MDAIVRSFGLTAGAFVLMSVSPAREPQYSAELLALLDPTAAVSDLCGGTGPSSMRAEISLAAAVVGQADIPPAVPLYGGLGKVHFPITTSNPLAQRYFDQGLGSLTASTMPPRSPFREAQRLDPQCAMCFWGEAFARGPNINAPMDPAGNARAVSLAAMTYSGLPATHRRPSGRSPKRC